LLVQGGACLFGQNMRYRLPTLAQAPGMYYFYLESREYLDLGVQIFCWRSNSSNTPTATVNLNLFRKSSWMRSHPRGTNVCNRSVLTWSKSS
jgi:hypothetical protein